MKFYYLFIFVFLISCGAPEAEPFQGTSVTYQSSSDQNSSAQTGTVSNSSATNNTSSSGSRSSSSNATQSTTSANTSENNPNNIDGTTEAISVILNEILYDASGSDTDGNEFIELLSTAGSNLSGIQIIFINGADGKITETISLPNGSVADENGLFVVADLKNNSNNSSNILHFNFLDNFDPQNGPDSVQLISASGELLDAVAYGEGVLDIATNGLATGEGSAAIDVTSGHSLSRVEGSDSQDNASDFIELELPSPGVL